jgi:hypothetical protein
MRNKPAVIIVFLLLSVFTASQAYAWKKAAKDKQPKTYKSDLDADTKQENISVDSASTADGETKITISRITKRDQTVIGSFTVRGIFNRLEIVDLNEDGYKQIAVFCVGDGAYTNLALYSLKNGKLSKIFAAGSSCGIETNFRPGLSRIKVGREIKIENGVSYTDIPEWDAWVWSGERFIKG